MTLTKTSGVAEIYRPVQYLGSKLRTIPLIVEALARADRQEVVWDPFTGSSVVAQALARAGHRIVATDALRSSATFARALLGVDRLDNDDDRVLAGLSTAPAGLPARDDWRPWLDRERELLETKDGLGLIALSKRLPQRWRSGQDNRTPEALLSDTYAGTYFGITQALELEGLRRAIEVARGSMSTWAESVALTALCHAASTAVFSAGKHFAQPIKPTAEKDLTFHARRILHDRSVDTASVFTNALQATTRAAASAPNGHRAEVRRTEDTTAADLMHWGITTVYADPPYTAQQYSRYYHLLETLVAGKPSELQIVNGKVTAGLYPVGRYLSPYCSRTRAPAAFRHLARSAHDAGARLLLSYSGTTHPQGKTGNARTLQLEDLLSIVREFYPASKVSVTELELRYRQFNHQDARTPGRSDPEFLIIGEC